MDGSEIEILRPLAGGGGGASVDLVRIDGRPWVLKRHRPRDMATERLFQRTLVRRGLPALHVEDHPGLGPDQLLLEYVPDSPTLGGKPSPELCRRWGAAIGALHGIATSGFEVLDEQGVPTPGEWPPFLAGLAREALGRQRGQGHLPEALLDRAETGLAGLAAFDPPGFVLTHGDLHLNNALARGDGIVLFDKPAGVWTAPPVFDLCLVFSEAFPGARYGADRPGDDEKLAAFLEGYGPFPEAEARWLEHFVLLRSLRRYPSPFVPEMRSIIEIALDRLEA